MLLFQDTCRSRLTAGTSTPPFFCTRHAPGNARFYAQAAANGKVALENCDGRGGKRGVFSMTLMDGLRGSAGDRQTGEITSNSLAGYLQENMRGKYQTEDPARDDVSKMPEIISDAFPNSPSRPHQTVPGAGPTPGGGGDSPDPRSRFRDFVGEHGLGPMGIHFGRGQVSIGCPERPEQAFPGVRRS